MKQYIKLFEQFICENSTSTYDYGCMMVYFDFPQLKELQDKIEQEDIYTEEGDKTYGLEDEPHTTILYGIHSNEVSDEEILNAVKDSNIGTIILHNASIFENDKYDVLKFDAFNGELHKLNTKLQEFPFTSDYPDYHPHATIGYLKKGTGKKYVELLKGVHYEVTPNKFVYSKPSGDKIEQPIGNEELVNEEKSYVGDNVGIMYDENQHIMYIGSKLDNLVAFTIYDIPNEESVLEIKEILKNVHPDDWKHILRSSNFEIGPGHQYFELTK